MLFMDSKNGGWRKDSVLESWIGNSGVVGTMDIEMIDSKNAIHQSVFETIPLH